MTDRGAGSAHDGDALPGCGDSIEELLDRAAEAINRGDRATATVLAEQVLAADGANADAEDLLTAPSHPGEIRRLTLFFADLVDSTALSTQVEPETYRLIVGRYREQVLDAVSRYEGHIGSTAGDGLLAVFGHPIAHEDDVRRAVHAGLEIVREVARLSAQARRRFGIEVHVRIGVHRGLVYLDTAQDDVYGLASNLAARVSSLAPPNAVVVSSTVEALIRNDFELDARPAAKVKGVDEPIVHFRVLAPRRSAAESGRSPLVGRTRELARLRELWTRAEAGTLVTPGLIFRGEPGIGKSRLAAAAAELATTFGGTVLELAGSPFHTDTGLYPIRTLLERRCGIDRHVDQFERLRRLEMEIRDCGLDPRSAVPLLAPILGIQAQVGYEQIAAEGQRLYELIVQQVQAYLLACLGGRAGLVVAEDLHWFDISTHEVLSALLDAAGGHLLVVMTGRPDARLPADHLREVFDLAQLTDEQTDALIGALDPNMTTAQRAAVAARCDGVPFYIEQVVNGRNETGVPEALYEPLFARLRASPKVMPVVETAAILGRQFDRDLLCAVVDADGGEVDDVIHDLEDALVLEPKPDGNWRFRHELLREIAAELAPPSVRRGLHAKVADALIAAREPDWHLVAVHYAHAERFDDAAVAYQQASNDARRRGALSEARACLNLALDQLEHVNWSTARDRRETALRLERGFLSFTAEGYQSRDAATDFEQCLQIGDANLADDELFATLTAVGNYYLIRADLQGAAKAIDVLRAGLDRRPSFRPAIDTLAGAAAWIRGDFDAADQFLRLPTVDRIPANVTGAVALPAIDWSATSRIYMALVCLARGDYASANAELMLAARVAQGLGFPWAAYTLAYTQSMTTWLCIELGDFDRAAIVAVNTIQHAELNDLDMWPLVGAVWQASVEGLTALGGAHVDSTSLDARTATLAALLENLRALGVYMYTTVFDAFLGRLHIAAGQYEVARDRLDTGLRLASDTGMHFYDSELLRLRAHTHAAPEAMRADLEAALTIAQRQGAHLFRLRAAIDSFEVIGESARNTLVAASSRVRPDRGVFEVGRARVLLGQPDPE